MTDGQQLSGGETLPEARSGTGQLINVHEMVKVKGMMGKKTGHGPEASGGFQCRASFRITMFPLNFHRVSPTPAGIVGGVAC